MIYLVSRTKMGVENHLFKRRMKVVSALDLRNLEE